MISCRAHDQENGRQNHHQRRHSVDAEGASCRALPSKHDKHIADGDDRTAFRGVPLGRDEGRPTRFRRPALCQIVALLSSSARWLTDVPPDFDEDVMGGLPPE